MNSVNPSSSTIEVSDMNELVIISPSARQGSPLVIAGRLARCFVDYTNFKEADIEPAAFIIKSDDESYIKAILSQIRQGKSGSKNLIFVDSTLTNFDGALCDGALPKTVQALNEGIEAIKSRTAAIVARGDAGDPEARLLEFMWLRPGYVLEPRPEWQHSRRFRYPILETLDPTGSDPDTWLARLENNGFIERVALKDRQRECNYCGSAQLSFIDVCPNCRSIDIDQHKALHCFTCGLIAPEVQFHHDDQRLCPKCGTRLRHIGTDYDRPLETSSCSQCSHIFVEGDVIARCLICDHSMSPTELRTRHIYSWRLTGLGRLAAQGRGAPVAQRPFDSLGYSTREHFETSLEWMLKVSSDCCDFSVGLIGIRLENMAELGVALGSGYAAETLDAFAERLREVMDDVDLATRMDDGTFVLLLPNSDKKRLHKVRTAVGDLFACTAHTQGPELLWTFADLLVTAKDKTKYHAASLLKKLDRTLLDSTLKSERAA
ncbi:MAG: diguanylate cyclase domain-containing protein [Stenotrophobium sp.]